MYFPLVCGELISQFIHEVLYTYQLVYAIGIGTGEGKPSVHLAPLGVD